MWNKFREILQHKVWRSGYVTAFLASVTLFALFQYVNLLLQLDVSRIVLYTIAVIISLVLRRVLLNDYLKKLG